MKRRYIKWALGVVLLAPLAHAVPVTPATIPHVTFVNGTGGPCAGCKLYTYIAGTTTPLATYVDAAGVSVNANPVILDGAGGANLWLGRNSYKFILKDALGTTIWSVDQVNAANLFPCGPANTVQIANSGVNGLNCDSQITIDTVNHTFNVGTLPTNHVTIGALSTPTSWTFDTTTPATACASIGCVAATGSVTSVSVATANGISGVVSTPTTTPSIVLTLGNITPLSVAIGGGTAMSANQGTGTKVQHSTGTTVTNNCAKFDATGNTIDAGISCAITSVNVTQSADLSSSRVFGTQYQNTGTTAMHITGWGLTGGSATGSIACLDGPSSATISVWLNTVTATVVGGSAVFTCLIPAGWFYKVTVSGTVSGVGGWYESVF